MSKVLSSFTFQLGAEKCHFLFDVVEVQKVPYLGNALLLDLNPFCKGSLISLKWRTQEVESKVANPNFQFFCLGLDRAYLTN